MADYTVTVRYDDAGSATDLAMTITAGSPEESFIKDGDTYRFVANNGNVYVFPEASLISVKFIES